MLELDAGFAGGVCRCSECGTLMTVPADPGTHRAERLSRPDAPGATGRPDTPMPNTETPAPEPTAAATEQADGETFVTDTGRVVRIGHDAVIPTASKKRAVIRATTAVAFFAVVFFLLALMGGAVWLMTREAPPPDTSHLELQTFVFDRDANPWTMDKPNVLGMSLGAKASIVVDASGRSSAWLADVKSAIAAGLTRADSRARVAVLYATAKDVQTLGGGMQAIGNLNADRLLRFQEGFEAEGEPPVRKAVETAIGFEPEAVILVIGRRLDSTELDRIKSLLLGNETLLDVVAVGRDDPALEDLAEQTGGRYQFIARSTLENWRAEASP
jgi:hypothetical protein